MAEQPKRANRPDWLFAPLGEIESYRRLREAVDRPGALCVTGGIRVIELPAGREAAHD